MWVGACKLYFQGVRSPICCLNLTWSSLATFGKQNNTAAMKEKKRLETKQEGGGGGGGGGVGLAGALYKEASQSMTSNSGQLLGLRRYARVS